MDWQKKTAYNFKIDLDFSIGNNLGHNLGHNL